MSNKARRQLVIEQFNNGVFVDPKFGEVVWQVTSFYGAIYDSERNGFARESFVKWFNKFDADHGGRFVLNLIDRTGEDWDKAKLVEGEPGTHGTVEVTIPATV